MSDNYREYFGDGRGLYVDGHIIFVSPFYLSLSPVNLGQWKRIINYYGISEDDEKGPDDEPVNVTWDDAIYYCNERSRKEGLEQSYFHNGTGYSCRWNANGYRLPTEAEFMYAKKVFGAACRNAPDPFLKNALRRFRSAR